jgi:hypothetical protein
VALFLGSPFFEERRDWRASGELAALFLRRFSEIVPQLPQDSTVEILGLPWVDNDRFTDRQMHSATQLHQRSVQAWLDINHPGNGVTVRIRRYGVYLEEVPRDFDLQVWIHEQRGEVRVNVKPVS